MLQILQFKKATPPPLFKPPNVAAGELVRFYGNLHTELEIYEVCLAVLLSNLALPRYSKLSDTLYLPIPQYIFIP